jgi:cell division protein FtsB
VHVDPAELLALVDRVEQLAHDVQRLRAEREQLVIENHVLTRKIAELRDRD